MSFQVLVDTVQQRLKQDGVSTSVEAQDWDLAAGSNVFLDGVTGTVFLNTGFNDPNWLTSNTGIYAKFAPLSDLALFPGYVPPAGSTPANWQIAAPNSDGAPFAKFLNNTAGASGQTIVNMPPNQAMVVEMSIPLSTSAANLIGDFGYGPTMTVSDPIVFRFYGDFSCDVWESGTFMGHYTVAGQVSRYGQSDGQQAGQGGQLFVGFLIIPCREREILVLCSAGGGFSYIRQSIPEGTSGAAITPNAQFWFYAPPGVDQGYRIAPCQFQSSGNAVGKRAFFRVDPGASPPGGFQTFIAADLNGGSAGLSVADGDDPANPYANNTNGARLNVELTGSTVALSSPTIASVSTSPNLYGARGYTLPQTAETVGPSPLDVTGYVLELAYEWGDSVSGLRCPITLADPKGIIAAGATLDSTNQPGALFDAISERPWQVFDDDGTQILEGLNEPPRYRQGTCVAPDGSASWGTDTNPSEWVSMDLRDPWLVMEIFEFKEPIPLDGMPVASAFTLIFDKAGVTDSSGGRAPNISSALSSVLINRSGNPTRGFNMEIQPGDKGSDWADRLFKTYCGNYFMGLVPANGWAQPNILAESDMPSTPALTLYDSLGTATAQGVDSPTYLNLFRTVDVQMLKPEANDIYIQGRDFRTGRPLLVHRVDTVNSDPTVAPAGRTPAWRGNLVSYAWIDPTLSDIDSCNYAMGLIFPRVTQARSLIEFEADFSPQLYRGALVQLWFASGGGVRSAATGEVQNPVTARIKTVSARFRQLGNDGHATKWRPARYVAQVGTDVSILHSPHTSLRAIQAEWELRCYSKRVQWGDATTDPVFRRPLILQMEAS